MNGPKCSLCGKEHWQRDGCDGKLQERVARPAWAAYSEETKLPLDTQREGRRVLKGSTGKPAKPTRTAATAKADPPRAKKAKEGEPRSPEPTVREPGATARPAKKKAKPRRVK